MLNQNLQYFCLECGGELFKKTSIHNGQFCSSEECLKYDYTLLFGTNKKLQRIIITTTKKHLTNQNDYANMKDVERCLITNT